MSTIESLEPIPEIETRLSKQGEQLMLGSVLIVGLTFGVPILSIIFNVPALVFVVLLGFLYAVATLLLRRILAGLFIGFVVTAGFAANIPLARPGYFETIPGALGPDLWLAQLPLVLVLFTLLFSNSYKVVQGITLSEILFGAFVGWSVLAAIFGATVRTDVALYFSLLMAQICATIILTRSVVQYQIVHFRTIVGIFAGSVFAQSLFAAIQLINGSAFGVSTLGESGGRVLSTFSLGPLGTIATGTYISGFTGGQFILASLIVLAVPILFATSIKLKGWPRAASLGGALVMTAILRTTAGDAARGGLLVAVITFSICGLYTYRKIIQEKIQQMINRGFTGSTIRFGRNVLLSGITSLLSLILILYPSSESGASSVVTTINKSNGMNTSQSNPTQSAATTTESAAKTTSLSTDPTQSAATTTESAAKTTSLSTDPTQSAATTTESAAKTAPPQMGHFESILQNLSIPYFSLSNLGIRFQQYIAGFDLFAQYPLLGIGGGNFMYHATEYGLPSPMPLHNIYISVLAETGLPGFLLYVGSLMMIIWSGMKIMQSQNNKNLVLVGVLCGIVGYLAYGFFDYLQLLKPTSVFPFGLLAGAVLGQYRRNT